MPRGKFLERMTRLGVLLLIVLGAPASSSAHSEATPFPAGIGDRVTLYRAGQPIDVVDEARRHGLPTDYLQLWLPRGWQDSWLEPEDLHGLATRGVTPVVAHWYFGDVISRERIEADRRGWHQSLGRMARRIAGTRGVMVLLEPEFNNAPPEGETATTDWPGFADEIREAARIVRHYAPHARVGLCAGDFSPARNLETAVGPVADDLDFLAFQEMRGSTRHEKRDLDVGAAAVSYAQYLRQAFQRPILLGYVAVSSHGDWESDQAAALDSLARQRHPLMDAGVFGMIWFQLRDDPEHVGWFGPAEKHFGVLTEDGSPKPSLKSLQQFSLPVQPGAPPLGSAGPESSPTPR